MGMLLQDVAAYLESQGIGTQGTDLFYGIVPENPDAMVTLFEYSGGVSEPKMGTQDMNLEYPRVQVISRGVASDYDGPRLKLQQVVTALTKVVNTNLSGTNYKALEGRAVSFLQRDANFRVYFVCNFEVTKDYSGA